MPSEGKPQPIDTVAIATPDDVPATDLWLLTDRRERHMASFAGQATADASAADALAALALGVVIRRKLDDQEQRLVLEGRRRGATWEQLAGSLNAAEPAQVRSAFMAWAQQLPEGEAAEALHYVGNGTD
ncbi:hypothetical protein [Streptomyces sp. NEAU-NA10]|uniref:hypothetical protein n=1 Tax=Streptomyces sp. NEAU-NA10 TaxID=3416050 RepID=UPI003CC6D461